MTVRTPHRSRFAEAERRAAVERVVELMAEGGYSQNKATAAVGEDLGVSGRTIKLWAVDAEVSLGQISREATKTARATEAIVTYGHERRQALSDLLFSRVEEIARASKDSGELKDATLMFCQLTDKRRLEEGKATERNETVDQRAALDRGKQNLRSIVGGRSG